MDRRILTGGALALALVAGSAHAQTAPGQPADIGTPAGGQARVAEPFMVAQASEVDETALRYFARQGDTRRVEAEIARLKALYPDWEPPENLLADDYTPDAMIERIWELFGEGDFAGARAAIAEKQESDPDWTPSADLSRSLQLGEGGERMRNASDSEQYETVISIAANMPELLTCDSVDLLWSLADAFIATGATQRGVDAYTYVLTNCEDPGERFTTLQQASERLDADQLVPLLALERTDEEGPGEFAPLRVDIARNSVVDVLAGRREEADPEDVARLEEQAEQGGAAEDLRLLGWYALNQHRPEDALDWFEQAMAADSSNLSALGLGSALLDLDRFERAEETLSTYVGESEELTTVYLSAAAALLAEVPRIELEPAVLERIVETTVQEQAAAVAQELGWYAYDFTQSETAAAWFETALDWDPDDEASAYGLVVASDRLGADARVDALKAEWAGKSQRIATFGTDASSAPTTAPVPPERPETVRVASLERAAPAAEPAPRQTAAPTAITVTYRGCSTYVPAASLSPQNALNRGWCLLDLLRPAQAAESFGRALQSGAAGTRTDAAYGQALSYIRLGLAEDAAVAAAAAPQSGERQIELQTAILTLTAVNSYQAGDYGRALMALDQRAQYAAEQNDLLTLRAWSYYHLGRYVESEQIFEAVAATGYRDAASGLEAVRGVLRQIRQR